MHLFRKSGLLSHEFFEPGIFYFSDQSVSEAAGYFGTIIVKPKVVERFIELTRDGFSEGLIDEVVPRCII
jgi:hypothetical protein